MDVKKNKKSSKSHLHIMAHAPNLPNDFKAETVFNASLVDLPSLIYS